MKDHEDLIWYLSLLFIAIAWVLLMVTGCGSASNQIQQEPVKVINVEGESLDTGFPTCNNYRIAFDARQSYHDRFNEDGLRQHEEAFNIAVEAWNSLLNYPLFNTVDDDICTKADIHVRIVPDPILEITQNVVFQRQSGPADNCACFIAVGPAAAPYWKIYAHALGHCLGLNHASSPLSLMYAKAYNGDYTEEMLSLVKSNINTELLGPETIPEPLQAQCMK